MTRAIGCSTITQRAADLTSATKRLGGAIRAEAGKQAPASRPELAGEIQESVVGSPADF